MINHSVYNSHIFFYISKNFINFYRCLSINKREEILLLKEPKFVYLLSDISSSKYKNVISVDKSFSKIDKNNNEINLNNKYDKKNKSHLKQEGDIETRKNKIKFKKKTRNKMSLDKEDLFVANNSERVFNGNSLDEDLIRQPKNIRNKKKHKLKQSLLDSSLIENDQLNNTAFLNKEIVIDSPLTIKELSIKLQIPEAEIITWLFLKGISVTINQFVDISIASEVANHYSFNLVRSKNINVVSFKKSDNLSKSSNYTERPPVITIFGHIDHGKTTLLDTIRNTHMVKNEAGGITQCIAGYEVDWVYNYNKVKLVFLDTPGHEAFIGMRSRGAQVTDIAVLVVAADDGLKPQTFEVIKHIKDHKLPCIIAINKVDKPNANILKVKEELAEYNLIDEDLGGSTPMIEISALTGQNIDSLLSHICMISQVQQFKAVINEPAEGTILEAYLDKTKGPIANILVQNGTLNIGDIIISTSTYGKVKALIDHAGVKVSYAQPSSIVQVWGFSSVPQAGSQFKISISEKEAKQIIQQNINSENQNNVFKALNKRVTFDLYKNKGFSVKQLNLIIKADTQGSIEAIIYSLAQIPQDKVQLNILFAGSGNVSNTDIDLAITSNSILIVFNINISTSLSNSIKKSSIVLHNTTVIYNLLDFIQDYMLNLLEPEYDKVLIGTALVQTVFDVNKGSVAGCIVNKGKLKKNSSMSIYRESQLIYDGVLNSLKRVKNDIDEAIEGNECGVMCYDYHLWQQGDVIKVYQMNEKKKTL